MRFARRLKHIERVEMWVPRCNRLLTCVEKHAMYTIFCLECDPTRARAPFTYDT